MHYSNYCLCVHIPAHLFTRFYYANIYVHTRAYIVNVFKFFLWNMCRGELIYLSRCGGGGGFSKTMRIWVGGSSGFNIEFL